MDTLTDLAIKGGAFTIVAVVLGVLAKLFVTPPLKAFGERLIGAIDHNTAATNKSIETQAETRDEVIRMSARLDALVSIDERDEKRAHLRPVNSKEK